MFEDLKVLELASVLAGPSAGQFFAELGATVIKVENAKTLGDVTRNWKTSGEMTDDRSSYFCSVNWGKRSIGVNLESLEGRQIVHRLVKESHIVIASYKPGDAARMGVDYETLRKLNPRLIYAQITGYGSDDQRVGYDAVIQAESGFMSINGEPGGQSLKMPVALIDILAAHQLKEGILLSMLKQTRSGEGDFIEVSLIQTAITSLANQATNWLIGGKIPQKQGSSHPNIAPYGDVFTTAEGREILLAIGTDKQFSDLTTLFDVPEMATDSRFSTNQSRVTNRAYLRKILSGLFLQVEADSILKSLAASRIPAGPIRNIQEVFELAQAKELLLYSMDLVGVRTYAGQPHPQLKSHFLPPPHFGEHTVEILSNTLKMDPLTIQKLLTEGSVR